ncbi:helix-turn-helix domain-containing protein [Heyndrickxia coagulans]|uniref:helix-turn-helix domain-containing protein n=1 Tax=Heyndrickxia coagulans TaxID=1398 RepID=UPI003D1E0842
MHRNYYAIIPANVRYDKDLNQGAKLLYGEITALSNEKGYCWAGNSYFAELYGKNKSTIARWIQQLEDKGYITREIIYKKGSHEIESRHIKIRSENAPTLKNETTPSLKNETTPSLKNEIDNNTFINNTNNNIKDKCRKQVYDESSVYFRLANRLYERILENNPNHKKPNLQKWANDVRLMMERDKRTEKQITYLIDWCQNDNFWKANILSTGKLREKFDQLIMQVKSKVEKEKPQHPKVYVYDINAGED